MGKIIKGIFGGGKKKAAAASSAEATGPKTRNLTATEVAKAKVRRGRDGMGAGSATPGGGPRLGGFAGLRTLLSERLGRG